MKNPFYQEGIHFECQGSGKCCVSHGEFGFVFLSQDDSKRMAKTLKITTKEFKAKYCHRVDGALALKDQPGNPDCIFLKNKQCSVYEGRPVQCRTWPFWPEVMNARKWKKDVEAFCPGIGKGRLFSRLEIEAIADEETKNVKKIFKEKK